MKVRCVFQWWESGKHSLLSVNIYEVDMLQMKWWNVIREKKSLGYVQKIVCEDMRHKNIQSPPLRNPSISVTTLWTTSLTPAPKIYTNMSRIQQTKMELHTFAIKSSKCWSGGNVLSFRASACQTQLQYNLDLKSAILVTKMGQWHKRW